MSYRIFDVECIGRAKTTQFNLTGEWKLYKYIYIYKPDGHFQRARHKNGSVFCFQWARRRNGTKFIFGSKEPDTRMAQGSFWFQRARHKNGFVSNGPDTRMTQVHFGSKEPDTGMAHLHIYIYKYIYIFASKLRTPAPMDSKKQVRFQYPTPGSSLATPWWRVEWPPAYKKFYI